VLVIKHEESTIRPYSSIIEMEEEAEDTDYNFRKNKDIYINEPSQSPSYVKLIS
jgi:hypothetical protein